MGHYQMGTRIPKAELARRVLEGRDEVREDTITVIAGNTVRYMTVDGDECIKLYDTVIIRFLGCDGAHSSRAVCLDSGGHRTSTTKSRMNDWSTYTHVYQEKNVWYVSDPDGNYAEFVDGIVYDSHFKLFFRSREHYGRWLKEDPEVGPIQPRRKS